MDRHFLEFWGNFLINTAKGQQQVDDLTQWMQQGFKGFEELATLFRKAYGLQKPPESTPDYQQTWHKATSEFKESLNSYLSLLGVIPLSEHLALLEKYEALKNENAEQLNTIQRLRDLLGKGDSGQTAVVENFKELVSRQNEQFQKLMDSFGSYVKEASSGDKKPAKK
ncbi:MAG: hypothetical protein U5J82_12985 [Desulfobacterales bacterium]|jgi:hypothetical protein|nr:hypothetical protein [Desulfobacterales bacterium]